MRRPIWVAMATALCAVSFSDHARSAEEPKTPVERGQELFTRVWNEDEGLGPEHNAKSCVACHVQGGIGGAGGNDTNVDVVSVLSTNTQSVWLDQGLAGKRSVVLHRSSTDKAYASQRFAMLGIKLPNCAPCAELPEGSQALKKMQASESRLRTKGHRIAIRTAGAEVELAKRNTTPLFGLGEVDRISEQDILRAAERARKQYPNISGRFGGKFGWRGQTKSLKQFVMDACENEIGLTKEESESEETVKMVNLGRKVDVVEDLTAFIAALPRPRQVTPGVQFERVLVHHGEKLFESVGCNACHTRRLGSLDGLYSDMLLHDMGPQLADNGADPNRVPAGPSETAVGSSRTRQALAPVSAAAQREWKTPALWGCAESAPYLHDGRAPTLNDAILMHGGEAAHSVVSYRRLDLASRKQVLAFLSTLRGPDRTDLERITGPQGGSEFIFSGHW